MIGIGTAVSDGVLAAYLPLLDVLPEFQQRGIGSTLAQRLLVRRGDTGTWALPGGTLEWGETLMAGLPRVIAEETGAKWLAFERVTGVYSRPDRDPRFHAVTICVVGRVAGPARGPKNKMEIREARFFAPDEVPQDLAMGQRDMLDDALGGGEVVLE